MGMRGGQGNGSEMVVTVDKAALIRKLEENRGKHIAEYKAACEVYKRRVNDECGKAQIALGEFIAAWKSADMEKPPKFPDLGGAERLPKPVSYEEHYNRALGMLRLHTKDEMTIDISTYRTYVEDDWDWSERAKLSNSRYLGG